MRQHIIEGQEAEGASIGNQIDVEQIAQWGDKQPKAEEAQSPDAQQMLEILDGIKTKPTRRGEIKIPEAGTEAEDVECPDGGGLVAFGQ